jgi:hypothetical protein
MGKLVPRTLGGDVTLAEWSSDDGGSVGAGRRGDAAGTSTRTTWLARARPTHSRLPPSASSGHR